MYGLDRMVRWYSSDGLIKKRKKGRDWKRGWRENIKEGIWKRRKKENVWIKRNRVKKWMGI